MDTTNSKSGMTVAEMKAFIREHFEELINKKNLEIIDTNLAPEFLDHGTDVPSGTIPGAAGAKQYVGGALKRFPDLRVEILDMIAEDDKVVVRNRWRGTDTMGPTRVEFCGMVIWRIARRKIVERWAYLENAHPAPAGTPIVATVYPTSPLR
jgi:predicted SnoaL-like aldol condensation-catalyzing enzyme